MLYKDKTLIGLDIGTSELKIMAIDPVKWVVVGHGAIDIDSVKMRKSIDGDGEYLLLMLKKLLSDKINGTLPSSQVAVSIPTSRTYSRTFSIAVGAKKNLQEAIEIEVSQYVPVPLASLYLDYEIIQEDAEKAQMRRLTTKISGSAT